MPATAADTVAGAGVYVGYAVAETAAPATPTAAPAAAWKDLGYASTDGLTFGFGDSQEGQGAWQSAVDIRRLRTSQEFTFGISLLEWNELTLPVAFGGGAIDTPSAGLYRYKFPLPTDGIVERAYLFRWKDENPTRNYQLWVPRAVVSDPTETQIQRSALGELPLSVAALQPNTAGMVVAEILTDDPLWA